MRKCWERYRKVCWAVGRGVRVLGSVGGGVEKCVGVWGEMWKRM